ncbi:hypothetical protein H6A60_11060, partial [Sutterella massiliensis]|nr:hypothetical protein [Sutterella massiliensis]
MPNEDAGKQVASLSSLHKAQSVVRLVDDDESVLKALSVFLSFDDWQVRRYGSASAFLSDDNLE